MEKVPFGKFGFVDRVAVDWMRHHFVALVCGVAFVVGAVFWGIYQKNSGSPEDYFVAETTFNQWEGGRDKQLIKLQKILKQHPELRAKYDGRIAQKLLLCSEQGLAASFSKSVLKRVGNFSPYYTRFSEGSLLIGGKKFQEALTLSKQLKADLDEDRQFWKTKSELIEHGQMLYGYNLLRIAFLEQALSNREGEIEAWREFQERAGWIGSAQSSGAYALIAQNFQKDEVSLKDFVQYREKILTSLEEQ